MKEGDGIMSLPRCLLALAGWLTVTTSSTADPPSRRLLPPDATHAVPLDALVFWSNEQLVSADRAGEIRTWDVRTGKVVGHFCAAGSRNDFLFKGKNRSAVSSDGTLLFAGSAIWDLGSETAILRHRGYRGIALSPSAVAYAYGYDVRLRDLSKSEDLGQIATMQLHVEPLAFSADGKLLAVETWDTQGGLLRPQIVLYETATKQIRFSVPSPVFHPCVQFSRDGGLLAVGRHGSAMLYSTETGKSLWRTDAYSDPILLAISYS
jgi:WD40 repeat protein